MPSIAEDEVLEVIRRIEHGEVSVLVDHEWEVAWGPRAFTTSDGWRFVVFNDGGQWDYIEQVDSPDGRCLEPDDWNTPRLDAYSPASIDVARRWGLSEAGARTLIANAIP